MKSNQELKEIVKESYSKIAEQNKTENETSCCGVGTSAATDYSIMYDDYGHIDGYENIADLGLGCGLPTEFAEIKIGNTVLDLGSGAGNDCFVARHETGPNGKVIGVDFSPAMIAKARENASKLKLNNVEFRVGDIDDLPIENNTIDVVVSNCVLNLLPEKNNIFKEIHRVLNEDGHFSISDVVLSGALPEAVKQEANLFAGCVSGAIPKQEYLQLIEEAGFKNIRIQKEKEIVIPDQILEKYLKAEEIKELKENHVGIYSITVFASKKGSKSIQEGEKQEACCGPDCC